MKPLHSAPTLADAHFEIDKQIKAYKDCWCSIKKLQKAKEVLAWLTESAYQELHSKYLEEEKEKITYHPDTNKYEYKLLMHNTYDQAKYFKYLDRWMIDNMYKERPKENNQIGEATNMVNKQSFEETSRKPNKYLSIIAIITILTVWLIVFYKTL